MPTIAIDYTPAYGQGAGIGRYVRELTSALAQQDHVTNYRLFVAGATSKTLVERPGDNFVWRPTRLNPRWLARIWHRLKLPFPVDYFTGPIDLYHATDFVLPPALPNTRTLVQVHDLSFVRVPDAAAPNLKAYLDRVVPASVRRADHVLADSHATRHDLIELYKLPPAKVTVVYGGVDERFRPINATTQAEVRLKYKLDNYPYVFSVGTVQPRKNYGRLIEALARLRASGKDLHLVIAGGPGWLEDPIYQTVEANKMRPYVHFIGFVDDQDLPALYSAATCFAFPSLYEGFGFPVLEAMACQTPVVTSNISSLPEVAGDAALMVDPYDVDALAHALEQSVNNMDFRKTSIDKGLEQIKQFTWSAAAQNLLQVYEAVL